MLNPTQTLAAADLLARRPVVLPGTRVILDDTQRKRWYDEVCDVMEHTGVSGPVATNEFCDLAGVPD